ncbi:SAV_2336 N-terminal domain-related protein [Streptomyces sp. NPDC001848]|uniref:SAV_2336 N-terminal domain-related protein n=1 Tax=Streptomyces sp. NPDC001848 TaxID=3364618 RepID=UPI0036B8596A
MTSPPAQDPSAAPEAPLTALVERLRAMLGADPTARELAEALWLAGHLDPAALRPDGTVEPVPVPQEPDEPLDPGPASTPPIPDNGDRRPPGPTRLYADRPGPGRPAPQAEDGILRVRVPAATVLPQPLPLQRALRPLQNHRPPVRTRTHRLDEQATAERAAETGLLLPVLRPVTRREARLRLLMDVSTSTAVWDGMLDELRQICAGLGAFREVSVHYVHEDADGRPVIGRTRAADGTRRPVEQLRDPTGRQVTLVLSDCAGPLWRSGRMQRLLHHWARAAPVAVLQPLPQRMWRRTHLPALPGRLRRREGLGARLDFRPTEGPWPLDALPVPVLSPTRAALGTWARLLSGGTGLSLLAAAAWVRADHPAAPPRAQRSTTEPPDLVRTFRRTASAQAVRLAVTFSAIPLTLPVMQLVQRAMQPRTGPTVLAEVLLSGLLKRGEAEGWYDFAPGVREELLRLLPRGEALLVLKHCGEYVERHFGRRARNFPALALARLTEGPVPRSGAAEEVPGAFAEVSELVVGRYAAAVPAREGVTVVHASVDVGWALWAADVLRACGHEVSVWAWDSDSPDPETALNSGMRERLGRGDRVVFLLGDWYGLHRVSPTDEGLLQLALSIEHHVEQLAAVCVSPGELPRWAEPLSPVTHLWSVSEPEARRRLMDRLSLDADQYAPRTPNAPFPGRVRRVWGGVPDRDPAFTGAEDVLSELDQQLAHSRAPSPVCALVGPSGVGKTRVAVEYAHRHAADHDVVWWVSAEAPSARRERLAQLAVELGLDVGTGTDERIAALRDAARHRYADRRWLLVFDGWNDLHGADDLLISGCQVLVTTRDTAWAEAVPAVRMEGAGGDTRARPDAEADILARRALVRVDAPHGERGVTSGSGFFLAPGWVVTAALVVTDVHGRGPEARVQAGVTTTDGRRHQVAEVHVVGDVALLRVPEAVDPDCLWLSDEPDVSPGEVALYGVVGSVDRPRVTTRRAAATAGDNRHRLLVRDVSMPPGSAGGPVLDEDAGAVIGVIEGQTVAIGSRSVGAVRIGVLRTLWEGPGPRAELWHEIVRAHDRHHAERFRSRGTDLTWTGVQSRLAVRSAALRELEPAERTVLYELLAEIPPPKSPRVVAELLGKQQLYDGYPLCSWRDGVGGLDRGNSADLALVYAARVWARLAQPPAGRRLRALADLRSWVTETARLRDPDLRRAVDDVFLRVDAAFATPEAASVLVDIESISAQAYGWRVLLVMDGEAGVMAEDTSPTPLRELEARVRAALADVLVEADAYDVPAPVHFALPTELLWVLPVERWLVRESSTVLAAQRPVFVRSRDGGGRTRLRDRSNRWAALVRGPLVGVTAGLDSAPSTAVPVACVHSPRPLEEGLALGYPLMLWSRATRHDDCDRFRERVNELLGGAVDVRGLLARVGSLRAGNAARDPDAAWAGHLAVYYDPPDGP